MGSASNGMHPKVRIVVAAIIVVGVIAGVGLYVFLGRKKGVELPPTGEIRTGGIGVQIYEKSQNPIVDKLPETNPFGGQLSPFEQQTNPYKDAYKNPFGQ